MCAKRLAICVALAASVAFAGEPPDLEFNATTGLVEAVDIATDDDDRVRHVADAGQGGFRTATFVSTAAGVESQRW